MQYNQIQQKSTSTDERAREVSESNEQLHAQLLQLQNSHKHTEDQFQQSSDNSRREFEELSEQLKQRESENTELSAKLNSTVTSKEEEIAKLQQSIVELQQKNEVCHKHPAIVHYIPAIFIPTHRSIGHDHPYVDLN